MLITSLKSWTRCPPRIVLAIKLAQNLTIRSTKKEGTDKKGNEEKDYSFR